MAIRFTHRGKTWEVDTAKEAVRLRETLESMDSASDEQILGQFLYDVRDQSPWTPDTFWSFVNSIGEHQKKAVLALLKSNFYADKLAAAIGVDEQSLGGVLSGLSKQLKGLKLRPFDLYYVHTDWSNNDRRRLFTLEYGFRLAAEEMGWPEEKKGGKESMPPPPKTAANSETR